MEKTYVTPCEKLILSSSGIIFVDGRYSTDDPKKQKVIENGPSFGKHIFLLTDEEVEQEELEPPAGSDNDQKQEDNNQRQEQDEKPEIFKCDICDKEFGSAQALNGHMISHRRNGEA